jgi:hypothetical protein
VRKTKHEDKAIRRIFHSRSACHLAPVQGAASLRSLLTSGNRLPASGRGGMVDAGDLKSPGPCSCGFESRRPHQVGL